ncbi:MAG: YegS/Rv2252/BmrU family lipid kinase [Proteobacteria bacterium]|nr:YegS/Rv2252/BmrU family lipid kinase [Pseudomonadota bacterium]
MNPAAGGGRCGRLADQGLARLQAAGLCVESRYTCAPGDAVALAADAYASGCRDFVAVGGDGTAYEVVNGIFKHRRPDDHASLGFLPMGTGNSFLRDFMDSGTEGAIEALASGRRRGCDVIRLTHRDGVLHFINILSLGFVARVCELTNRRFKLFGPAGYALGVAGALLGLRPYQLRMRADGHDLPRPTTFVSVSNSRFTGGKMMMAPAADTGDGLADVISVGKLGRLALLKTFPCIYAGTHIRHPAVATERVHSIEFDTDEETDLMIDGEVLRHVPKRLDVLPGALQVRV